MLNDAMRRADKSARDGDGLDSLQSDVHEKAVKETDPHRASGNLVGTYTRSIADYTERKANLRREISELQQKLAEVTRNVEDIVSKKREKMDDFERIIRSFECAMKELRDGDR